MLALANRDTIPKGSEFLRSFLADHDLACEGCGYNLRGLRGVSCPECGAVVALGVVRAGASGAARAAMMCALAWPVVYPLPTLVILALMSVQSLFGGGSPEWLWYAAWWNLLVAAVSGVLLVRLWRTPGLTPALERWWLKAVVIVLALQGAKSLVSLGLMVLTGSMF